MKMRDCEENQGFMRTLDFEEIQNVRGGICWPFIDLLSILQAIQMGEDIVLSNIIQFKN